MRRTMRRSIDLLAAMEAFARVYETGSFSAAARRLRMGQPSVSRLVSQLEKHLGTKLLLRTTRSLSPTDAGKRVYGDALSLFEQVEKTERAARAKDVELEGRLRVAGTISFVHRFLFPRLPAFYAAHPNVELDFLLNDGNVGLVERGVEVALRVGKLATSGMTAKKIGQCQRFVVGSAVYFGRHGEPRHPRELAGHRAIVFSRGEGGDNVQLTRDGAKEDIVLRPRLRVDTLEGVRSALLANLGVAVVTEWIFGTELDDGRLVKTLTDWQLPTIDMWAVLPGGRRSSPLARAFAAFVEDQLGLTKFGLRASRITSSTGGGFGSSSE